MFDALLEYPSEQDCFVTTLCDHTMKYGDASLTGYSFVVQNHAARPTMTLMHMGMVVYVLVH